MRVTVLPDDGGISVFPTTFMKEDEKCRNFLDDSPIAGKISGP
jgi:hypothetical protein